MNPLARRHALFLLTPAIVASALAACSVPASDEAATATREALTPRPGQPIFPTPFIPTSHFRAANNELTTLTSDKGYFCTLDGVSGIFNAADTKATIVDDGTNYLLYASLGVAATAACTAYTNFSGTNIVPSAAVSTSQSPYNWTTEYSGKPGSFPMWGENASCTLSTIGGDWGNTVYPGPQDQYGVYNYAGAVAPFLYTEWGTNNEPWEFGLNTGEASATAQVNCFSFPAVKELQDQGPSTIYGVGELPLPPSNLSFCGLGEIDGFMMGPGDGVDIIQTAGNAQTASSAGNISFFTANCIWFHQDGS